MHIWTSCFFGSGSRSYGSPAPEPYHEALAPEVGSGENLAPGRGIMRSEPCYRFWTTSPYMLLWVYVNSVSKLVLVLHVDRKLATLFHAPY